MWVCYVFCTFTSSVWDACSSCRRSTRRPLNGKCWNAFRDETSSQATLLVKSVGEKLQAANTWSATWVFLFQCSEKVFDFWVLLLYFFLFVFVLNVPGLFTVDSGMFRQHGRLLGLLGDWVLNLWFHLVTYNLKKIVNECELISVEIIFILMFDKPGWGSCRCTELAHDKNKQKKKKQEKNSRITLQKEEKK